VATVEVIALLGARPVFADIERDTFNLDPACIEDKITDRTKAIIPVHLYGQTADMSSILDIAGRHGLPVICDGAQAIGAEYRGKPIGCYGDLVTLSFFPTKNLGGAGDGGMVLTSDPDLADKIRYLRVHGNDGRYSYKYVGCCSRLDELQAAILRTKLPRLRQWNDLRRRNAGIYDELLPEFNIALPVELPDNMHIYHQFTIRGERRDELKAWMKSAGVDTGVYYPGPLHLEEAYRYRGYEEGALPVAEQACREVLSLPVFPQLTDEQLAHVAHSLRRFFE
jgi:dTDP-4-amino-4,6-dideoxygalactose transaminase